MVMETEMNGRRICTEKEVAEVLEGFEEEMLASIRRGRAEPKREAEIVQFPAKLSEHELMRRQAIIDQAWERLVEQRRELERQAAQSCHRGPFDSDSNL